MSRVSAGRYTSIPYSRVCTSAFEEWQQAFNRVSINMRERVKAIGPINLGFIVKIVHKTLSANVSFYVASFICKISYIFLFLLINLCFQNPP